MRSEFLSTTRRRFLVGALAGALGAGLMSTAQADESMHFLIPGGAGGGWDGTARGVGMVFQATKLLKTVSF